MTRPAPAHAALLCDFVNTYDVESDINELPSPADLTAWLAEHHLVAGDHAGTAEDLATAIALREGLRAAMLRNHGPGPVPLPGTLETAVRALPLRVSFRVDASAVPGRSRSSGPSRTSSPSRASGPAGTFGASGEIAHRPRLVPVETGVRGGLAGIAAAVIAATADGTWNRLKVCQEGTCQWAFLDTSKNRSRTWCSMRVCGNRTKTRAYRARQRTER